MSDTTPEWLARLIESAGPSRALARQADTGQVAVSTGQLRYAPAPDQPIDHLLLILDLDETFASSILCSAELDLWADADVVLDPTESGLPYPVLAQADITVVVGVADVGQHVGTVDLDLCAALRQLRDGEAPASLAHRVGLPLQGRRDVRWHRKEEQAAAAWALSSAALDRFESSSDILSALSDAMAGISGVSPREAFERTAADGTSVSVVPERQGDIGFRLDLRVESPSGADAVSGLRLVVEEGGASRRRSSIELDGDGRGSVTSVRGPYNLRMVDGASPEPLGEEFALAAASAQERLLVHLESAIPSVALNLWDRGGSSLTLEVKGSLADNGTVVEIPVRLPEARGDGSDHLLVPLTAEIGSASCLLELQIPRSTSLTRGGFVGIRPAGLVSRDDLRRSLQSLGESMRLLWTRWASDSSVPESLRALVDEVMEEPH